MANRGTSLSASTRGNVIPELTAGQNLNFAALLATSPQDPGRELRKSLTENASGPGLSYNSCRDLKVLMDDGFKLVATRGVWDNPTTARNIIFVALDSIPYFRRPRLEYVRLLYHARRRELSSSELSRLDGARAKLSALLYEHVISRGEGAGKDFIVRHKLSSLASAPRQFLSKMDSLGALLRFSLPGVIDEERPGCVRPHHIEHSHLIDPSYCKRLFMRTLAIDLQEPLARYERSLERCASSTQHTKAIHGLANAIRENILQRQGGAERWLLDRGISSLLSRRPLQLKTASFGGLVDKFLPDVVNLRDPRALQPHEIHYGEWDNERYARPQLLRAFAAVKPAIPGIKKFCKLVSGGVRIPAELRNQVYQAACRVHSREFVAGGGIQSLYIRPPSFLSTNAVANVEEMARFCFKPVKL